jgi:hypothetical protein
VPSTLPANETSPRNLGALYFKRAETPQPLSLAYGVSFILLNFLGDPGIAPPPGGRMVLIYGD